MVLVSCSVLNFLVRFGVLFLFFLQVFINVESDCVCGQFFIFSLFLGFLFLSFLPVFRNVYLDCLCARPCHRAFGVLGSFDGLFPFFCFNFFFYINVMCCGLWGFRSFSQLLHQFWGVLILFVKIWPFCLNLMAWRFFAVALDFFFHGQWHMGSFTWVLSTLLHIFSKSYFLIYF